MSGSFLLRLEFACPRAVVALNLVILPTGLLGRNLSLEEGQRQRSTIFFSDSEIASTDLLMDLRGP